MIWGRYVSVEVLLQDWLGIESSYCKLCIICWWLWLHWGEEGGRKRGREGVRNSTCILWPEKYPSVCLKMRKRLNSCTMVESIFLLLVVTVVMTEEVAGLCWKEISRFSLSVCLSLLIFLLYLHCWVAQVFGGNLSHYPAVTHGMPLSPLWFVCTIWKKIMIVTWWVAMVGGINFNLTLEIDITCHRQLI